ISHRIPATGSFSSPSLKCLAYGISGNYLISRSKDGVVRVWDARTHNILRRVYAYLMVR
ncbi:hypothetical protein DVH24_020718, partial [Malus domestica]